MTSEMLKLQSLQIIVIIDVIVFKSTILKFLIFFIIFKSEQISLWGLCNKIYNIYYKFIIN